MLVDLTTSTMEVRPERRQTLALRWLVNYARLRGENTMELRLAREIMDLQLITQVQLLKSNEEVHRLWLKLTKLLLTSVGNTLFRKKLFYV